MKFPSRVAAMCILLLATASLATAQGVLDLDVGAPDRRDKTIALLLDGIVDTSDGAVLTPDEAAERLRSVRLLFVGESHASIDFHRAQTLIIEALLRSGRQVLVGLEMFPVTEQTSLDFWIDESPTEDEFVISSRWYEHWGYNWAYYREIFLSAQRAGVRMFALNAPRHVVSAVRQKGIDNLSEEEAAYMPPRVDTDDAEHLRLFKSYFSDDDAMHAAMTDDQWRSMFAAQCTWDATMGYNAVRALQEHGDDDAIMVVIIGSGHVSYGLGIERQARNFFDGLTATMIPVQVTDSDGLRIDTVRASYANYVWGIPGEDATLYPSLGLSTRVSTETEGLSVLFAQDDSLGGRAGIKAGDRLLSMDGQELADKEVFNRLMATKRWGDSLELTFDRGGETRTVSIALRRSR